MQDKEGDLFHWAVLLDRVEAFSFEDETSRFSVSSLWATHHH
jgi:hypothetical protein